MTAAASPTTCEPNACSNPRTLASPRIELWDIVLLCAILAGMLYGIGSYGLYEPHEGHFAGVGREMVLTGDWITPRLNGAHYLNKPPLFYWLIALSYSAFGISEWAARFPQALIGWVGVCVAWKWARELWGAFAGRVAAGILAISAGWYLFSHQLLIDEILCVLHLLLLYFLWKGVTQPERPRAWIWFYVLIGVSIMAKGLVGAAFPLAVLVCFALLKRDWSSLRQSRPWLGLLIVLALVAPWVVMVEIRNPGFLRYVIINEHWNRIFDKRWPPDYHASQTSAVKFLLITLVWMAPWSFFLAQIASFAAKNSFRSSSNDRSTADAVSILSLGALLPTLLFVPVPSRLIYYSLPTLPPFAVLAAGWWVVMPGPCYTRGRKSAAIVALLIGASIAGLAATGALSPSGVIGEKLARVPDLTAAPETLKFIPGFALAIGVGLAACGALLLAGKSCAAMLALCIPVGVGEALNTQGFAAFDPVRSSKRMVGALSGARDFTWVSEGSLELGAAAGIAYYLGPDNSGHPRFVFVLNSESVYRRPPRFPGSPPEYLIDDAWLAQMWSSPDPVLYVTDFLRNGDRTDDPIHLPPAPYHRVVVEGAGHREIYVNAAGWQRLNSRPSKSGP